MQNFTLHLRNTILGALGFGFGFVIGQFLAHFLFEVGLLQTLGDLFRASRLVMGVTLLVLGIGLGGAIGGGLGGVALSFAVPGSDRLAYAWRSALAFGFSYALILFPLTVAISLFSFYNQSTASPIGLIGAAGLVGLVFGAVSGLILGLLTVGWDTWRVFLAGLVNFALGGAALGYGLWHYFFESESPATAGWKILLSLFCFGAIGGAGLGFLYSRLARRTPSPSLLARTRTWLAGLKPVYRILAVAGLLIIGLAVRGLWLISPFDSQKAILASTITSKTISARWSTPLAPVDMAASATEPDVGANQRGDVALVWVQEMGGPADIFYTVQRQTETGTWLEPINVSQSQTRPAAKPQIALDSNGRAHLVWLEDPGGEAATSELYYSQCVDQNCTPPQLLSSRPGPGCPTDSAQADWPRIAVDHEDTLMVSWVAGQQGLAYTTWSRSEGPPPTPSGCIPIAEIGDQAITIEHIQLAGGGEDKFALTFEAQSQNQDQVVYASEYLNGGWTTPEMLGQGHQPNVILDAGNQVHLAWCGLPENQLVYHGPGGQNERIEFPRCTQGPGLTLDSEGSLHLTWYSDGVKNVTGVVAPQQLIYESLKRADGWTEPAIVSKTNGPTQPTMVAGGNGHLHQIWSDLENIFYTVKPRYECDPAELSAAGQAVYNIKRQEKFRPASDEIPFCHNRYEGLIFVPNPRPQFSDQQPTPNGGFDHFAKLARTAEYEVVFASMWYDKAVNRDSPGSVLAQSIAELYQNLKANPAEYPRGLTVRLLLGNPPKYAFFPTFNHQIWFLLDDLKAAGVPEMNNPELGWKLEVANFSGSWPHSHTKLMVVDGKTVAAVGFNMQYSHLPESHPSGLGQGRVDLGVQVTGPVAQDSLQAFDDLWAGSTQVICSSYNRGIPILWILACHTAQGVASHVPEVRQYFLPQADGKAFSLYRTQAFREADEAYYQALASAQKSIDTIQVNFTLAMVCDLGVLLEVCNFNNRLEYMDALMKAVENNGARARILLEEGPIDGVENRIAINALLKEVDARELQDQIEIRYFDGEVHIKATMIDETLLIVGSQNFHYSAWGDWALTEYSLGVEDPEAIADFKRMFEYEWEQGKPVTGVTEGGTP